MGSAQSMLAEARKWIGYKSPTGCNEFNRWYSDMAGLNWYYNHAWCDEFVSHSGHSSGNFNEVGLYAYCPAHMVQFFKAQGQYFKRGEKMPEAGDAIFFDWDLDGYEPDHIGLVEYIDNGYVHTIEGNTGAWPGEVARRSYNLHYACILGYGRPLYKGDAPLFNPVTTWTLHGGENQQWVLDDADDGYVAIRNIATGKFIDVPNCLDQDGTALITFPKNQEPKHGDNQRFKLEPVTATPFGTTYKFVSAMPGKRVLDVSEAGMTNGTKLILWPYLNRGLRAAPTSSSRRTGVVSGISCSCSGFDWISS